MARKANNPADRKPTCTSLVEKALQQWDDFLNVHQLVLLTGCTSNQVAAALHHLQGCEVVDAVVAHNVTFWFITGADTRERKVEERVPEEKGSRNRKKGVGGRAGKPVLVRGERFDSLTKAAAAVGLSMMTVRGYINDPDNNEFAWAE